MNNAPNKTEPEATGTNNVINSTLFKAQLARQFAENLFALGDDHLHQELVGDINRIMKEMGDLRLNG
jgi:hypothetical protein